jgi:type VI secretion system ImpA family protein
MTDLPSPAPSASTRKIPNLEDFLKNISSEDPAGPSLRYEIVYDEIRLSRQEDDPRLSMGVWTTDLKRADWGKIESLCSDALITKSKDLQIAAWLTESWTSLEGIEGYIRGIRLFSSLCETFWKLIHPQPQEGGDIENRLMIFEWMDMAFSSRLLLVPLTQPKFEQTSFGLGFYKSAQHNDATQKRAEKTGNSSSSKDPSKAMGTTEEFQRSLSQTPDDYLSKNQKNMAEALRTTQNLKDVLSTLLGADSPSFSQIFGTLKEMERILTTTLQTRNPPPPIQEPAPETINAPASDMSALENAAPSSPPETSAQPAPPAPATVRTPSPKDHPKEMPSEKLDLKTRDDAYRQLAIIATFLEQNDPHSFASQLLRQLIRWQNKNVLDIFGEIAQSPQEFEILMKILRNA